MQKDSKQRTHKCGTHTHSKISPVKFHLIKAKGSRGTKMGHQREIFKTVMLIRKNVAKIHIRLVAV